MIIYLMLFYIMNNIIILENIRQLKAGAQQLLDKATQLENGLGFSDGQAPQKGLSKMQRAVNAALQKRNEKFKKIEQKSFDK